MEVYSHPATSPALQKALHSALPYSISLTYRTQHPNRTANAHILATFPTANDSTEPTREIPACWATAYLDRSMRPETELWIFSSSELPSHPSTAEDTFCPTCKTAILSLISYMSRLEVPPIHPENQRALEMAKQHERKYPESGPDVRYPPGPGLYMRHLLLPHVLTLGAIHERVLQVCQEAGLICPQFPGPDARLTKFLFRMGDLPVTNALPEGLRWGDMRRQDLEIVQARTSIPRPPHTLLSMKSVGVFEVKTDKPVGWVFLGLDGSLTTLHVEPEHRGQGIAKSLASKLMSEHAYGLAQDEDGNAWAHADVYDGNVQSEAVCRSLGASITWGIYWVRMDLSKAPQ